MKSFSNPARITQVRLPLRGVILSSWRVERIFRETFGILKFDRVPKLFTHFRWSLACTKGFLIMRF